MTYKLYRNLPGGERVENYSTTEPYMMHSEVLRIHDWDLPVYAVVTLRNDGGIVSCDSHGAAEWLLLYQKWIARGVC